MAKSKKKLGPPEGAVITNDHEHLSDVIACLQEAGKTVVFTNGTFDLVHVGHLRAIRDAKSRGDYLIIGVNSDQSVKKYKHAKLPIVAEAERCEVLAGLRWVDYVTMFNEETADAIIDTLRPDIVAKGTDYKVSTVPERDTVKAYGGQVVIVGDEKKHASSKLIQRIRRLKM